MPKAPASDLPEPASEIGNAPSGDKSERSEAPLAEDLDGKENVSSTSKPSHNRQPSLSIQSKMRSSSFRRSSVSQTPLSPSASATRAPSLPPLSPEGDVTEIYRKQASRLDELEKENKRLAKEARESENRWRKTEEELEELREANSDIVQLRFRAEKADAKSEEIEKMVCHMFCILILCINTYSYQKAEITSLHRQNSQLQSQSSRGSRHASSPSQAAISSPFSDLHAQVDSKSSTIESMEMEISNLRAQLDKNASSNASHSEQISALEEKLGKAERAAGAAQRELLDVRKNLDRASEKAVKDGSERTSAETKIRSLSREAEESKKNADESIKRVDNLEKKLAALTTLHRESDARRQTGEKQRETLERDMGELRRFAGLENENLRLKEERERWKKREAGGADDEGIDELEDEERRRLETRVRELEEEAFELRRGVWKDKRKEMDGTETDDILASPGSRFDEIDLNGGMSPFGKQSTTNGKGPSFSNVLTSGFNAITGGGGGGGRGSLELYESDDMGFDEDAFRQAQEDEARQRVERIKEVKRGLKDWEGWQMDIVDSRVGGGGAGEIFDI